MKGFILVDFPIYCVDCKFCREINEGTEACFEMTIDPDEYDCYRMIEDYCQSKPEWRPIINPSSFFHGMRESTPEENERINAHIKSISVPTGINIFDLLDKKEEVNEQSGNRNP